MQMQAYASENKTKKMRVQIYQNIKKSLTAYGKICKIDLQFMEKKKLNSDI